MDAVSLLIGSAAALPKPPRTEPFADALQRALDSYIAEVASITATDYVSSTLASSRDLIREFAAKLKTTLSLSLQGQPSKARRQLDEALDLVRDQIETLVSVRTPSENVGVLYRVRLASPGKRLIKGDLFHIPFDKRHLVAPRRFSVIGVPMLYLGSTLFVCWEELGRPELDQMWMSAVRVQAGKDIRVLNLAYRPAQMGQLLEDIGRPSAQTPVSRLIAAYGVVWPLIAACTFQAKATGAAFIEEYVLPQLLMSWISERPDLLGARYFSTRVERPPAAAAASINYVLPARDLAPTGYCGTLTGLLEMTAPLSWSYADAIGTQASYLYHGRISAVLDLGSGHAVPYGGTRFAKMEYALDQLPFEPIC